MAEAFLGSELHLGTSADTFWLGLFILMKMMVHVQDNTLPVLLGLHPSRESLALPWASWELLVPQALDEKDKVRDIIRHPTALRVT